MPDVRTEAKHSRSLALFDAQVNAKILDAENDDDASGWWRLKTFVKRELAGLPEERVEETARYFLGVYFPPRRAVAAPSQRRRRGRFSDTSRVSSTSFTPQELPT